MASGTTEVTYRKWHRWHMGIFSTIHMRWPNKMATTAQNYGRRQILSLPFTFSPVSIPYTHILTIHSGRCEWLVWLVRQEYRCYGIVIYIYCYICNYLTSSSMDETVL